MIIGIHLHPDQRPVEVSLEPDGPDWWKLNGHGSNDAGLAVFFERRKFHSQMSARQAARQAHTCVKGFNWQCPYHVPICTPKSLKTRSGACGGIVRVGFSNYERRTIPILGQLSLWGPTEERVWVHILTGQVVRDLERPMQLYAIMCQQMAVAGVMQLMREGWKPAAWKILTVSDTLSDREWAVSQAEKFSGQLKPCTFDRLLF